MKLNRASHTKQRISLVIFDAACCPLDSAPPVDAERTHLPVVVAEIAKKLRKADLIARCHEEQFMALFPETPRTGARGVAEKIRKLGASLPVRDIGMRSVGKIVAGLENAVYPEEGTDPTTLIRHADREFHQGKMLLGIP